MGKRKSSTVSNYEPIGVDVAGPLTLEESKAVGDVPEDYAPSPSSSPQRSNSILKRASEMFMGTSGEDAKEDAIVPQAQATEPPPKRVSFADALVNGATEATDETKEESGAEKIEDAVAPIAADTEEPPKKRKSSLLDKIFHTKDSDEAKPAVEEDKIPDSETDTAAVADVVSSDQPIEEQHAAADTEEAPKKRKSSLLDKIFHTKNPDEAKPAVEEDKVPVSETETAAVADVVPSDQPIEEQHAAESEEPPKKRKSSFLDLFRKSSTSEAPLPAAESTGVADEGPTKEEVVEEIPKKRSSSVASVSKENPIVKEAEPVESAAVPTPEVVGDKKESIDAPVTEVAPQKRKSSILSIFKKKPEEQSSPADAVKEDVFVDAQPIVDELKETPAAEEIKEALATEKVKEAPAAEEVEEAPVTEEVKEAPAAEEEAKKRSSSIISAIKRKFSSKPDVQDDGAADAAEIVEPEPAVADKTGVAEKTDVADVPYAESKAASETSVVAEEAPKKRKSSILASLFKRKSTEEVKPMEDVKDGEHAQAAAEETKPIKDAEHAEAPRPAEAAAEEAAPVKEPETVAAALRESIPENAVVTEEPPKKRKSSFLGLFKREPPKETILLPAVGAEDLPVVTPNQVEETPAIEPTTEPSIEQASEPTAVPVEEPAAKPKGFFALLRSKHKSAPPTVPETVIEKETAVDDAALTTFAAIPVDTTTDKNDVSANEEPEAGEAPSAPKEASVEPAAVDVEPEIEVVKAGLGQKKSHIFSSFRLRKIRLLADASFQYSKSDSFAHCKTVKLVPGMTVKCYDKVKSKVPYLIRVAIPKKHDVILGFVDMAERDAWSNVFTDFKARLAASVTSAGPQQVLKSSVVEEVNESSAAGTGQVTPH